MKKIATNWRRIVAAKREVEWKIERGAKMQPRILGTRETQVLEWLKK